MGFVVAGQPIPQLHQLMGSYHDFSLEPGYRVWRQRNRSCGVTNILPHIPRTLVGTCVQRLAPTVNVSEDLLCWDELGMLTHEWAPVRRSNLATDHPHRLFPPDSRIPPEIMATPVYHQPKPETSQLADDGQEKEGDELIFKEGDEQSNVDDELSTLAGSQLRFDQEPCFQPTGSGLLMVSAPPGFGSIPATVQEPIQPMETVSVLTDTTTTPNITTGQMVTCSNVILSSSSTTHLVTPLGVVSETISATAHLSEVVGVSAEPDTSIDHGGISLVDITGNSDDPNQDPDPDAHLDRLPDVPEETEAALLGLDEMAEEEES